MQDKKIVIVSDHAGFSLKKALVSYLETKGYEVLDLGPETEKNAVDYPLQGEKLADSIHKGAAERGIAICGSGIGICMAVNRFPFIRGALVYEKNAAELAREHNDANVLCLGGRLTDEETAKQLVDVFLNTPFEGGRHEKRVQELGGLS